MPPASHSGVARKWWPLTVGLRLPTFPTVMKVLSVNKVLEAAGSPVKLQRLLWRAGQPYPTLRAIYGWKVSRVIPAVWQAPILWAFACKNVNVFRKLFVEHDQDTAPHIRTECAPNRPAAK
jgi:hypothetical protein